MQLHEPLHQPEAEPAPRPVLPALRLHERLEHVLEGCRFDPDAVVPGACFHPVRSPGDVDHHLPPSGVNFAALTSKLRSAWEMRAASALLQRLVPEISTRRPIPRCSNRAAWSLLVF